MGLSDTEKQVIANQLDIVVMVKEAVEIDVAVPDDSNIRMREDDETGEMAGSEWAVGKYVGKYSIW